MIISQIQIGKRFRKELGNLDDLAESIKKNGLLHPIVVTKQGVLLAGRRRIEAFKNLGLHDIPAYVVNGDINEEGEIDENQVRKDFTPEEMIRIKKYLDSNEAETKSKSSNGKNKDNNKKEADQLKFNRSTSRSKRIAQHTGVSEVTLWKLEKLHDAAQTDRDIKELWNKVNTKKLSTDKAYRKYKNIILTKQILAENKKEASVSHDNINGSAKLYHGGFVEVAKKYIADNSIDLIFADPPYGDEKFYLYAELARLADRVLKDGGSMIVYCNQRRLVEVINKCRLGRLTYWWVIAVQHTGYKARLFGFHIVVGWKPLVWFVKGRRLKRSTEHMKDIIESQPADKHLHPWQQSNKEAETTIARLTLENATVLDPLMGSGTTGIAALKLNRRFIGIEIDKKHYDNAAVNIARATRKS